MYSIYGKLARPLATYISTNQICLVLSHPLHILTNISVEANIVDPYQEQSTLFVKDAHKRLQNKTKFALLTALRVKQEGPRALDRSPESWHMSR